MEYRRLGSTGVKVSPLCLGAMMFGSWGNHDHDDCERIIRRALDAGINFVDTADGYSAGESEEIVGKALKGRRDDVVLATKFWGPMGEDPNQRGVSRRWIITEVENSLRRLGTDWIDLYQLHRPDPEVDDERRDHVAEVEDDRLDHRTPFPFRARGFDSREHFPRSRYLIDYCRPIATKSRFREIP